MTSVGKYLKQNMKYTSLGELALNLSLFTDYLFQAASIFLDDGTPRKCGVTQYKRCTFGRYIHKKQIDA